jgi:hypothetical protein
LYWPFGDRTGRPQPELFKRGGFRAGHSTDVPVPLGRLEKGIYRVVVQPCGKDKEACGKDPPREFAVELK